MAEQVTVLLPPSLARAARRLAEQDGVSVDTWVATAVAQKIGVVETASEFLAVRGAGGSGEDLRRLLDKAPDGPPDPEDEIPPDLVEKVRAITGRGG